jgi:hypothetical protein
MDEVETSFSLLALDKHGQFVKDEGNNFVVTVTNNSGGSVPTQLKEKVKM